MWDIEPILVLLGLPIGMIVGVLLVVSVTGYERIMGIDARVVEVLQGVQAAADDLAAKKLDAAAAANALAVATESEAASKKAAEDAAAGLKAKLAAAVDVLHATYGQS